ncbi:hypothetical protein D9M68_790770 [compost metagenome]
MGAISRPVMKPLPKNRVCDSPTAASVPSTVASRVASGATMKLLRVARAQSDEFHISRYHCSDQPSMG